MTPTELYIKKLEALKAGELSRLRRLAGQPLDTSLGGFDLFTGLWWPLRQKEVKTPRREVAWLVAKLYATRPMPQVAGKPFARQVGHLRPPYRKVTTDRERFTTRFDAILQSSLNNLELQIRGLLELLHEEMKEPGLDWVALTNDLSAWEKESIKRQWAQEFIGKKGERNVD